MAIFWRREQDRLECFVDLPCLAFSPAGPGAGVGGRGGGRGCFWHHAVQETRPAGLRRGRAPRSLQLHPVPHGKGAAAEGCQPGTPGRPPAGPRTPGATLCPCLPRHLQSLHLHQHPHQAAVSEVRKNKNHAGSDIQTTRPHRRSF